MENFFSFFCSFSSQKVCHTKSKILVSRNIPLEAAGNLSQLIRVDITNNLRKYLGMLLLYGRARKQTFSFLAATVGRKTLGWKAKVLPRPARALLI